MSLVTRVLGMHWKCFLRGRHLWPARKSWPFVSIIEIGGRKGKLEFYAYKKQCLCCKVFEYEGIRKIEAGDPKLEEVTVALPEALPEIKICRPKGYLPYPSQAPLMTPFEGFIGASAGGGGDTL